MSRGCDWQPGLRLVLESVCGRGKVVLQNKMGLSSEEEGRQSPSDILSTLTSLHFPSLSKTQKLGIIFAFVGKGGLEQIKKADHTVFVIPQINQPLQPFDCKAIVSNILSVKLARIVVVRLVNSN